MSFGLYIYIYNFFKNISMKLLGHQVCVYSVSVDTDKVFQHCHTHFHYHKQCMRLSVSLKLSPNLLLLIFQFVTILVCNLWCDILWIWLFLIGLVSNLFISYFTLVNYYINLFFFNLWICLFILLYSYISQICSPLFFCYYFLILSFFLVIHEMYTSQGWY